MKTNKTNKKEDYETTVKSKNLAYKKNNTDHIKRAELTLVLLSMMVVVGLSIMQSTITGFSTECSDDFSGTDQSQLTGLADHDDGSSGKLNLTGETIVVHPYELPNPTYALPLLFLLLILATILALHKAKISVNVKKALTILHVVVFISTFVMILMTFNIPEITGEAVNDISMENGLPVAVLMIIITAAMTGMITYVTLDRTLSPFSGDNYFRKSKYWTGYAMQKVKWSAKKKIVQKDVEIKIKDGCGDELLEKDIAETHMFKEVSKTFSNLAQSNHETQLSPSQPINCSTRQTNLRCELQENKISPDTSSEQDKQAPIQNMPKISVTISSKPKIKEVKKEKIKRPENVLKSRFKTDDVLEIAEKILNMRASTPTGKTGIKRPKIRVSRKKIFIPQQNGGNVHVGRNKKK